MFCKTIALFVWLISLTFISEQTSHQLAAVLLSQKSRQTSTSHQLPAKRNKSYTYTPFETAVGTYRHFKWHRDSQPPVGTVAVAYKSNFVVQTFFI
jgi:hypothetical protein